MSFPSSVSPNVSLDIALAQIVSAAGAIKLRSQTLIDLSLAGPVDGAAIVNYLRDLVVYRNKITTLASTPGLTAYAQSQFNNALLDIVAEYNTMLTAITNTISWIATNFPKDGTGFLIYEQITGDGTVTYRTFTTATLATFRTVLGSLVTTIA